MTLVSHPRKLRQQPLKLVLCQVRWSPIQTMATYIPVIQETFRRRGFPIERSGEVQQMLLGPRGLDTRILTRWEFLSMDERWSIQVLPDSIVLQTTAYDRFEGFLERLSLAVETVLKATDHDQFGVLERLGLRYVDQIRPRDGESFRDYVMPGFHGLPDDGVFLLDSGRLQAEVAGTTRVGDEEGTLVIRLTQNDEGQELPMDLQDSAPAWDRAAAPGARLTLLDTDHFLEGKYACSTAWIAQYANLLHDRINEVFFDKVITPHALEAWS